MKAGTSLTIVANLWRRLRSRDVLDDNLVSGGIAERFTKVGRPPTMRRQAT